MNTGKLLPPIKAARKATDDLTFYSSYPLREWALVKTIRQMTMDNVCGKLCSLRFTWQRPKNQAANEDIFLFQTLPWLLDVAWLLADAPLSTLHIERVTGKNNLFALAMFGNGVAAEIEMNECLPDSMPATNFIKANFTRGHLTNQPVVGHFNEEGSILADDSGTRRLVIENSDWDDCGDEMEICHRAMARAIERGEYPAGVLNSKDGVAGDVYAVKDKYPAGPLNSKAIINAIQEALR